MCKKILTKSVKKILTNLKFRIIMKSFLIDIIKTLFFNIIGICILVKSICYICEHNDISFLIYAALFILASIGIYFIRVNFLKPTIEEISRCAIILFLYAANRKLNEIEKDDINELALNKTTYGEIVKEFIDKIE